jgi:hypothetical protein
VSGFVTNMMLIYLIDTVATQISAKFDATICKYNAIFIDIFAFVKFCNTKPC